MPVMTEAALAKSTLFIMLFTYFSLHTYSCTRKASIETQILFVLLRVRITVVHVKLHGRSGGIICGI